MLPTQLHSYLLWRSTVDPNAQSLASRRYTATVALIPAAMVGIFVFGWYAGLMVVTSILAAFLTDLICHRFIFKDSQGTRDGTWMLTGLLIGLMMPPAVSPVVPVVGSIVAVLAGKYILSVDNMPLLQPAALGLALLFLFSGQMNPDQWPVLKRGVVTSKETFNAGRMVVDFLGGDVRKSVPAAENRKAVLSGATPYYDPQTKVAAEAYHGPRPIDLVKKDPARNVTVPVLSGSATGDRAERYDTLSLILGYVPGRIGDASALALMFGILLLVFSRAVSPIIPIFGFATLFAGLHFLAWLYDGSARPAVVTGNIPIHILTGSTLIGFFYLAADPTTSPRSTMGKIYAGVAIGVIELLLRMFTPFSEAMILSVFIVQNLSFLIDQYLAPPRESTRPVSIELTSSSLGRL